MAGFAVNRSTDLVRVPDRPVGGDEPVSRWESARSNFDAAFHVYNSGARDAAQQEALWARHRDIERLTGRKLAPSSTMAGASATPMNFGPEAAPDLSAVPAGSFRPDAAYEAEVDQLREQFPDQMRAVPTRDGLHVQVSDRLKAIAGHAAEASGQNPVSAFVGQAAGSMTDARNLAGALATGPLGVGRALAMRMLIQGAANAGIEAAQAPGKIAEARRSGGPEYTAQQAGADIAAAGVGGAGFELAGAAAGAVLKRLPGVRRLFAEAPALRGAAQVLDRTDLDHMAVAATPDPATRDAGLSALERFAPRPAPPPAQDLGELFGPGGEGRVSYQGRDIYSAQLDPGALGTDAATFQYKSGSDAAGVTDRLRNVELWDPTSSGKVIAYERADGTRVIADGHQRLGLAQRKLAAGHEDFGDIRLDGYLFREVDGWRPAEVRTVAALKNLRENSGTTLDAAKVFRDAPDALSDRSLPVSGEFISQARGLARLSDETFRAVINKALPERWGAELGAMVPDRPELHDKLARTLRSAAPADVIEIRAVLQEALEDDWIKAQGEQIELFGEAPEVSAMIGRAKVKAAVMRELARDAKLYTGLVRNADAIEAGGNSLARDDNEARLATDTAALTVMGRLAHRDGPLKAVMAEAAAKVAGGQATPATASKPVLKALREALAKDDLATLLRAGEIDPKPPSEAAQAMAVKFDDPAGEGAREQIAAKPEDAAQEADLFDDLGDGGEAHRHGHTVLQACAPGAA